MNKDGNFEISTGGNNRQWTKRYKAMLQCYKMLCLIPEPSEKQKYVLEGYKICMEVFHNKYNMVKWDQIEESENPKY